MDRLPRTLPRAVASGPVKTVAPATLRRVVTADELKRMEKKDE